MVVLRLTRGGSKKKPFYRIIAVDSRKKRDGKFLDILGYYNPIVKDKTVKIDMEKYNAWIEKGAQVSETVKKLAQKAV